MKARITSWLEWLDGLAYTQKFFLIGLLFALPAVAVLVLSVSETSARIYSYGYQEKSGAQYLRATRRLLEDVQQHQLLADGYLTGSTPEGAAQLSQMQRQIEQDLATLDQVDRQYGSAFKSTQTLRALEEKWQQLRQSVAGLTPEASLQQHTQVIADIRSLISLVGDTSNLILDPDLDSYYMMTTVVLRLPEQQDLVAQTLALGQRVVERGTLTPDDKAQLLIRRGLLSANLDTMQANIRVALDNNPMQNLEPLVPAPLQDDTEATQQFLQSLDQSILNSSTVPGTLDEFTAAGQQALKQSYRLYDTASPALEAVIQNRINWLWTRQLVSFAFSVVVLLVAFAIGLALMRNISRPLAELTLAAGRLAAGDLATRVAPSGRSEVVKVGVAFDEMAQRLQAVQQSLAASMAQQRASVEVSHAVSSILDPQELMQQTVNLIRDRFGFYYVGIFMLDMQKRIAVLRAGTGEAGQAMLAEGHKLPADEGSMIGRCVTRAEVQIALDVGSEAVRFDNPLLPETRSELALPLRSRGQVIGAVTVQSTRANAFTQEETAIMQTMADQLAVAIDNARLFSEAQAAVREIEATHQRYLAQAWRAYEHGRVTSGYEKIGDELTPLGKQVLPAAERAVTHKRLFVETGRDEPGQAEQQPPVLVTPIMLRDQPIGALGFMEPRQSRQWSAADIALAQAIGEQFALAAENLRLLEETQRRAAQEQVAGEITSRMRETLDIETVLKTAASEMRRAFGLDRIVVRLAKEEADKKSASV
jgi:GAF domain-containing protein/HAMP domain-containing protein